MDLHARALRISVAVTAVALVAAGCGVASQAPPREPAVQTISYADHPDTVFDLHRPQGGSSGLAVVLVHGGFWRERYVRDLMDPLVGSLLADGHVVVNLEYRRVGGDGGWPTTLTDVAAGIDALADVAGIDPDRVVTVGHSAGGHLALWAAARHRLPAGAPGAEPVVRPCHVVSQAGVVVLGEALGLGAGAVAGVLGGTDPERLRIADPSAWLPLGVPVTLVHGREDESVPLSQSERWVELATVAGDPARLVVEPGGHFVVIDPTHTSWAAVLDTLRDTC